jgi:hypothetical protein
MVKTKNRFATDPHGMTQTNNLSIWEIFSFVRVSLRVSAVKMALVFRALKHKDGINRRPTPTFADKKMILTL